MKNKKKQTTHDLEKLIDEMGIEKALQEYAKIAYDEIKTFKETELSFDESGVAHVTITALTTDAIEDIEITESVE